jgi:predicted TIM-barrel fold metal-dependent hydrolase
MSMIHYRCISTDDHLQEAPDTWTSRMSKQKWGSRIPTAGNDPGLQDDPNGAAGWYIDGKRVGMVSVNGAMPDRTDPPKTWDEVPAIAYVPSERIKAMDADGVDVHTLHPNFTQTMMNDPDYPAELRLDIMRAYNDFIIDEYGEAFPGRFILLAQVPYWDPGEAVTELRRCLDRSSEVRGVNFGFPQAFGYPHICDPVWDPLWGAVQDADIPIHLHIGSGGAMGLAQHPWSGYKDKTRLVAERSTKAISAHTTVATTLLFSGIFERFERLKVVFAETGAGWVPYLLQIADHQWERQNLTAIGMPPPSELFRRNCYTNFWFERIDAAIRADGLSNLMWLSDFPHPTCTWPTSRDYLARSLVDTTAEERQAVLVDNPRRVYNLPEGYEPR